MFSFGKKRLSTSGLFRDMTDNHSHILPGVDDGIATMDDSLAALSLLEEQEVTTVWLTPHIMEDIPNTTAELTERFEQLKAAYHGPISLHLAAEYMIDNLFEERLANGDLLLHSTPEATRKELLVETSFFNPPMNLYGTLERIKQAGYFPILAHPERYMYMTAEDYCRLHDMDVVLQLNLFSLTGMYGPMVQKRATKLLAEGRYSMVGTDTHRVVALQKQIQAKLSKQVLASLATICKE